MTKISDKLREEMANDPYYEKCARQYEHTCRGRITWEHAWTYAGKQIQEKWAIIPLCEYHHDVCQYQDRGALDKQENQRLSLLRATPEDLKKYPKKDWVFEKQWLNIL